MCSTDDDGTVEGGGLVVVEQSVSVVIPARNASRTIGMQLEALCAQDRPVDEVLVVDNGSTDGLADVVTPFIGRPADTPRFRLVRCDIPGVNHARNAGVSAATGEYVLLCDADDIVAPGWAGALVRCLEQHPLVGGATIPFTTELDTAGVTALLRNGRPQLPGIDRRLWDLQTAIGCNLGFHRSLWERLGGFDTRINGSLDENEFVFRARLDHVTLTPCPDAVVAYRRDPSVLKKVRRSYQEGYNRYLIRRTGTAAGLRRVGVLVHRTSRAGRFSPSALAGASARLLGASRAAWDSAVAQRNPHGR